ncbi:MAG: CoA transferase subunit A [Oscillospiraceae bacterium]|nr:CoA transferase subunit A [Oscillospiraceae bacterium]
MVRQIDAAQAAQMIPDGATLMIGGFMSNGTPEILVDALIEKGVKNLTVIANDAGTTGTGIGKLIAAGAVRKIIASHIGLNPMAGQLMGEGKLEVELVPQGTLIEQIRAGGAGLGGVLTPTGLGTDVANGKQVISVNGKEFLLEEPLRADFALVRGSVVDEDGNIFYKGTTRNFNPVIATAADIVIAAAEQIVPPGEIPAESIATPGIFVDYMVGGEPV